MPPDDFRISLGGKRIHRQVRRTQLGIWTRVISVARGSNRALRGRGAIYCSFVNEFGAWHEMFLMLCYERLTLCEQGVYGHLQEMRGVWRWGLGLFACKMVGEVFANQDVTMFV